MSSHISDKFNKILSFSGEEALRTGHLRIGADHIMLALIREGDNEACLALAELGVDTEWLKKEIDKEVFIPDSPIGASLQSALHFGESAKEAITEANRFGSGLGLQNCSPDCLLMGIIRTDCACSRILHGSIKETDLAELLRSRHLARSNENPALGIIITRTGAGMKSGTLPS